MYIYETKTPDFWVFCEKSPNPKEEETQKNTAPKLDVFFGGENPHNRIHDWFHQNGSPLEGGSSQGPDVSG